MAIPRRTGAMSITVDTTKVVNMLNNYERNLPISLNKASKRIAGMYSYFYLAVAQKAGIDAWTGQSFNILRRQITNPIRTGKGEYTIVMPSTLIALDSMRPHYVALKKGRSITRWAKAKLGIEGRIIKGINVRPHPFIASANRKARKNIRTIAEFEINKTIKSKGKI